MCKRSICLCSLVHLLPPRIRPTLPVFKCKQFIGQFEAAAVFLSFSKRVTASHWLVSETCEAFASETKHEKLTGWNAWQGFARALNYKEAELVRSSRLLYTLLFQLPVPRFRLRDAKAQLGNWHYALISRYVAHRPRSSRQHASYHVSLSCVQACARLDRIGEETFLANALGRASLIGKGQSIWLESARSPGWRFFKSGMSFVRAQTKVDCSWVVSLLVVATHSI